MRDHVALLVTCLLTVPAGAADGDRFTRFYEQVKPVLEAKCVQCHGADKQKGGLRLDSLEALRKGGDNGPALVPGHPDRSLLMHAVRHARDDMQMPPREKLKEEQIAALEAWIRDGAVFPQQALVLFEDDADFAATLWDGDGSVRVDRGDRHRGSSCLAVAGHRQSRIIPGWNVPIREKPGTGEYRYLRFAWKKQGPGDIVFGLSGKDRPGPIAWMAGKGSGRKAERVAEQAPEQWTVVTRDLWKDGGKDFTLTGLSVAAVDGGEARIDSIILGPTRESLEAYLPERGKLLGGSRKSTVRLGDAWSDPNNPIRQLYKGERLDLWSLKKPVRPVVPAVKNVAWTRTPIDNFLLQRMEGKGLAPSREADRRTLIRRLTFDLTGLPPTPEEVRAFIADQAPDAYDKLVEKLLASPRYGERAARLWLDIVRYADSNGFERDEFRPSTWHYRDYVIRAFNQNKPYDQFVREQLAGDELVNGSPSDPANADRLIATGYLRLGPFDSTRAIFQEEKKGHDELMADLVTTTGSAFLGLTFACCQCHDHKYDPLSQADHYRLRAFFAAVQFRDDIPIVPPAEQEEIARHNAVLEERLAPLKKELDAQLEPIRKRFIEGRRSKFPPDILELLKIDEKKRDEATKKKLKPYLEKLFISRDDQLAQLTEAAAKRRAELAQQIKALTFRKRFATALAMSDFGPTAPPTHLLSQGDYTEPRDEVQPGFPSVLAPNAVDIRPPSSKTTGRRLALADWIVSPDNPWTARVLVNRLWQQHFGRGIVGTPSDFGYSGARPTHPELLDWLAVEFVNKGWSIKDMHRLLVRSAAYRQESRDDASRRHLDPDNTLFWRQNVQRLAAENLRDSLLAVSGLLLPYNHGTPLWPSMPRDLLEARPSILEARSGVDATDPRLQDWYPDPLDKTNVRSIFLIQKRSLPLPFLQVFDLPEATVSCAQRSVTTVAPQALTLLNSPDTLRFSQAFAERVTKEVGAEPSRFVTQAVWLVLGRAPDADELRLGLALLQRHAEVHRRTKAANSPEQRAAVDLCRALLNLNEFIFID